MSEVTTEPVIHHSHVFVEWLCGSHEIACDYSDRDWCCKSEAKWVLYVACPACTHSQIRLAGTGCKDLFLGADYALECPACGEPEVARKFLSRVEAI
ncbi:MAG TPA: hypothetical protein VFH56_14320 [Acidimicrobiales bacterium]|nr:hypothetical protein [Acidimicrobiales bacterium]